MSENKLPKEDMKDIDRKFWETIRLENTYYRNYNSQQKNEDKK